ncbi:transcription factor TFIIIB component B [Trichonephila inaurata madagascariensis]|uniref:Transcription factor TFIIIB component B n=1 Tax=Trichonephila inaurata madagascariensis TaxID=2747483 RepID=A0A8X6IK47_9ARAC|nr:transcription factor TFIIIB component B [Trichonephila inaurata madagascariensis]
MASVAMLSLPIKKEPDVLPRASVFPKRKPGLSAIATRSRFVKARPNINLSSSKTPKDSPVTSSENNSTSENVSPEPVESKPEILQRPVLPKRTANVNVTPRARFQKARPNIGSLLSKNSKDSHSQQEEKAGLPPDDGKNVEVSTSCVDVSNAVEKDPVSNADSVINNEPSAVFRSLDITEAVKSPVKVAETFQIFSASTTNNYNVIISDEEKSSDTVGTQLSLCKDNESSSVERTSSKEQLEKELPAEAPPTSDFEDNSSLSSRTTNEVPASKESPSPTVNKSMEYPTLKSILNSPRKRTATKKAHERRKRIANLSSTPSRSEMTMVDLIYWNPTTSPMKTSKPATGPREEDLLPPDEDTGPSVPPEEPEEDFSSAPKVIINADGEIILDESSLVVRRKDTIDRSKEAIIENDHTTYSSFRKRSVKTWTKKETAKFYKALSLVGTDFALMENIFQVDGKVTRTRRELKLKFKREEKLNTDYVHTAIYELHTFNVSILDEDSDEMTENSEIVDGALKNTKKSNDSGTKNPSGRGRKKKPALLEASVDENHSTTENTPDILDLEDERVETINLENNNETSCLKNAPALKSKVPRPERTRKAKTLTDFVTDLDDLSENEEENLLPRRKRKVHVLSEESEDNLPETVDKTDNVNESVNSSSEGNVNNFGNIISEDAENTQDKEPSPVKKRRKQQIMPKINQNKEEYSQKAKHQTKLNDFLVGIKKSKNKSIDWDEDSIKAFEYCQKQLSESATLAHPLNNAHLAIMVDASDNAIGKDNIVANAVSRIDEVCLPPTIDYAAIAAAQDGDQELAKLTSLSDYNLKFDKLPVIRSEYMITCEVSTGQPRPFIPAAFHREIFECYHRTSHPVTDQGNQFESELFYELSKLLGFKCKHITAYHPQANSLVDKWHHMLKAAIMWHRDATYQSLPTVLLGLRTTIHEDLKATSVELFFGENLCLPGDFLHDSKFTSPLTFVQQLHSTFADQRPPPYEGLYPVIKRYAKYFDISIKRVSQTISIDRLKPCFFADPDPVKPISVDKSSTTNTSPSSVSAALHHSQQGTFKQSSKLQVRFA